VYIACRSLERGERAKKEIARRSGSDKIHVRKLDLASFDSIREFAKKLVERNLRLSLGCIWGECHIFLIILIFFSFLNEEEKLHILINNAGIMVRNFISKNKINF
jgi:NAD(P)-dependent dehydrogenase (short-subunit alcohol dehydrogenase family)